MAVRERPHRPRALTAAVLEDTSGNFNANTADISTKPLAHHEQPSSPWVWYAHPDKTVPARQDLIVREAVVGVELLALKIGLPWQLLGLA